MRKVLLDEGVARSLAKALRELAVDAVAFPNDWKRLPDRDLLERMAAEGYDLLLTSDKNMPFQQSLIGRRLAVLVFDQVDRKRVQVQATAIADNIGLMADEGFWRLFPDGRVAPFHAPSGS